MYSEGWNQIIGTIVLNCFLFVVHWTFHYFLKPNRPGVTYMFLKDNFPVPTSHSSFCHSYYEYPKGGEKISKEKYEPQGSQQEDFLFMVFGVASVCLFCQLCYALSQMTLTDVCDPLSFPNWAAAPADAWRVCHITQPQPQAQEGVTVQRDSTVQAEKGVHISLHDSTTNHHITTEPFTARHVAHRPDSL